MVRNSLSYGLPVLSRGQTYVEIAVAGKVEGSCQAGMKRVGCAGDFLEVALLLPVDVVMVSVLCIVEDALCVKNCRRRRRGLLYNPRRFSASLTFF